MSISQSFGSIRDQRQFEGNEHLQGRGNRGSDVQSGTGIRHTQEKTHTQSNGKMDRRDWESGCKVHGDKKKRARKIEKKRTKNSDSTCSSPLRHCVDQGTIDRERESSSNEIFLFLLCFSFGTLANVLLPTFDLTFFSDSW